MQSNKEVGGWAASQRGLIDCIVLWGAAGRRAEAPGGGGGGSQPHTLALQVSYEPRSLVIGPLQEEPTNQRRSF